MGPLTPDELERVLAEAVRRLRAVFDPCTIYLFGSYAEGRARDGSDIDLLVVARAAEEGIDGVGDGAWEGQVRARRILRDLGVPKDVIVYTPERFLEMASWGVSIARDALERGRLLHAA